MYYREEQNHRWAHNLKAAKAYCASGEYEKFYRGDMSGDFKYPGMKILGAFWICEDMEMKERLSIHNDVLKLPYETECEKYSLEFYEQFISDFHEFGTGFDLFSKAKLDELTKLARAGDTVPEDWQEQIVALQAESEQALQDGKISDELRDKWFDFCGRFILSYARNLIRQGVRTALYVKYYGKAALEQAIEPTEEYFSWMINRIFYNVAMPKAGFEDLGDIVSLGSYGMLADQAVAPSTEEKKDDKTYKRSYLTTCQLYGFIDSCADFLGQPKGCTTAAYCKFCVGHGRTTMNFVVPPDRTVKYYLEEGLGYGGKQCVFVLETQPGEDDERCNRAAEIIFGDEELSYKKK